MPKLISSTEDPKPQSFNNIQLYHNCEHCNKEFQVLLCINSTETQAIVDKCLCTHCNKFNDLWVKLIYNP